jgi:hypothetical protein
MDSNEFRLTGRLIAPATYRILDTGVTVTKLMVACRTAGPPRLDVLELVVWDLGEETREAIAALKPGTLVEAAGRIERRFDVTDPERSSRVELVCDKSKLRFETAEGNAEVVLPVATGLENEPWEPVAGFKTVGEVIDQAMATVPKPLGSTLAADAEAFRAKLNEPDELADGTDPRWPLSWAEVTGDTVPADPERAFRAFALRRSTIEKCPSRSLLVSHYRSDGTCLHYTETGVIPPINEVVLDEAEALGQLRRSKRLIFEFVLEADSNVIFPDHVEFVDDLRDALPREWFSEVDPEGDWSIAQIRYLHRVELEATEPMELVREVGPVLVRRNTDGLAHGFGTVELVAAPHELADFIALNWDDETVNLLVEHGELPAAYRID